MPTSALIAGIRPAHGPARHDSRAPSRRAGDGQDRLAARRRASASDVHGARHAIDVARLSSIPPPFFASEDDSSPSIDAERSRAASSLATRDETFLAFA